MGDTKNSASIIAKSHCMGCAWLSAQWRPPTVSRHITDIKCVEVTAKFYYAICFEPASNQLQTRQH